MTEPLKTGLDQGELTPQQREKVLVRLWKRGLYTIDCVAYHYTSLESVAYLIASGALPGHTGQDSANPDLPQHGDIYFEPRNLNFPYERVPKLWDIEQTPFNNRKEAAVDMARGHKFCSVLGLDIAEYREESTQFFFSLDDTLNDVSFLDEHEKLKRLGLPEDRIRHAVLQAKTRNGVFIGLKRSALDSFPLSAGDGGYDFRLSTGEAGLPINAISGIKPLGPEELAFFQRLQAKKA